MKQDQTKPGNYSRGYEFNCEQILSKDFKNQTFHYQMIRQFVETLNVGEATI